MTSTIASSTVDLAVPNVKPHLLTPRVIAVASKSEPGAFHQVQIFDTGHALCDCRGYVFNGRCRHIEIAQRIANPRMCATCGLNPVFDGFVRCALCSSKQVEPLRMGHEWRSFCGCVSCGAEYDFTDASPLYCPDCLTALDVSAIEPLSAAELAEGDRIIDWG